MEKVTINWITITYHKWVYRFEFDWVQHSYCWLIDNYTTSKRNFHDFLDEWGCRGFDDEKYKPNDEEAQALKEMDDVESDWYQTCLEDPDCNIERNYRKLFLVDDRLFQVKNKEELIDEFVKNHCPIDRWFELLINVVFIVICIFINIAGVYWLFMASYYLLPYLSSI